VTVLCQTSINILPNTLHFARTSWAVSPGRTWPVISHSSQELSITQPSSKPHLRLLSLARLYSNNLLPFSLPICDGVGYNCVRTKGLSFAIKVDREEEAILFEHMLGHRDASMEKLAPKAISIYFVMEYPTLPSFVSRLVVLYSVFVIDVGFPFDLTSDGHGLRKLPGPALISVRRQCVF
jgi:hypothetical protein